MSLIPAKKTKILKVGLISKRAVLPRIKNIGHVINLLKKQKVEILVTQNLVKKCKMKQGYTRAEILQQCDLVIIFGGDGTILKTAGFIGKKKTMILGVNYGNLGFLAEISPEDIEESINKIFKEEYFLDKRALLRVTHYRNKKKQNTFLALNDAVINQGVFARLITLYIDIDDQHMITFKADGMIIATPTGSTAHSLSAGGPIIYPALETTVITPICPSALTVRPIAIPSSRKITTTIVTERQEDHHLGLTVDGQDTVELEYGDVIVCRKSSRSMYMIRFQENNYFKTLRDKLGWGETKLK